MSYGPGNWPEKLQEIIDEFKDVFDPMERYEMLYDWAKEIDELPPEEWNDETKVHGCQSEAHAKFDLDENGGFHMRGTADAQIVQGLLAITAIAIKGLSSKEVAEFSPEFAIEMGLDRALTPSRANGFRNMFNKVRETARTMSEEV